MRGIDCVDGQSIPVFGQAPTLGRRYQFGIVLPERQQAAPCRNQVRTAKPFDIAKRPVLRGHQPLVMAIGEVFPDAEDRNERGDDLQRQFDALNPAHSASTRHCSG
ncbi:hypothetical protein ROA7745_04638 [Roseovarius aestuarii]|uniref:Uncharacterized protein n=1 Tax=Roseovarius aestuarii TaxID=475083 RepID=A0A1X7BYS9_9RHOB|nr:hypothetical protein ROA7745_04638 [Roseovarius aestuarii]